MVEWIVAWHWIWRITWWNEDSRLMGKWKEDLILNPILN